MDIYFICNCGMLKIGKKLRYIGVQKMNERKNESKYIFLELFAVCFLAFSGVFVRYSALGPVNTGLWRTIFSVIAFLPLVYKDLHGLTRRDVLLLLLSGLFFGVDLTFYNLAICRTSMANTNLFANLTAFVVLPVSYFVFKERMPKHFLLGTAITLAGVFILVRGKAVPSESTYIGDLFAFFSSVFYGFFILITQRLRDRFSSNVIIFVSSFGTIIGLFAGAYLTEGSIQVPHGFSELWPLIGLALFMQVIGHNLLAHCQGKLSVNLSSVITLSQPAFAAIYSFLFFRETLTFMEICGIIIVVAGVYLVKRQYTAK